MIQIQTTGLHDDFAGANCHVANYFLISKACNHSNNLQISGIETCCGGRVGSWCGWGGGNRGSGLPTQSDVDTSNNVTKNYYPDTDYRNFTSAEKQKLWQNHCRYKNKGSNTMSASEMSRKVSKISTHVDNQRNRVRAIECATDDSALVILDNDKDTKIVVLGRYIGMATDIGSTMTYKKLKGNGEYVCRTNVRPLILTELASPDYK